jgi:hypothetical protein
MRAQTRHLLKEFCDRRIPGPAVGWNMPQIGLLIEIVVGHDKQDIRL